MPSSGQTKDPSYTSSLGRFRQAVFNPKPRARFCVGSRYLCFDQPLPYTANVVPESGVTQLFSIVLYIMAVLLIVSSQTIYNNILYILLCASRIAFVPNCAGRLYKLRRQFRRRSPIFSFFAHHSKAITLKDTSLRKPYFVGNEAQHNRNCQLQHVVNHVHSLRLGRRSPRRHNQRPHDPWFATTIRQSRQQSSRSRWFQFPM